MFFVVIVSVCETSAFKLRLMNVVEETEAVSTQQAYTASMSLYISDVLQHKSPTAVFVGDQVA